MNRLNRDGIPGLAAERTDQNSHRLADGWQVSMVRAIPESLRCIGYAYLGRSGRSCLWSEVV
ncbi:hypothetical protein JOF53_003609 [Crossiella equi]|uniref:Uncharacterized protein n=1 Tax=Crossiella equi TaxID=130796 RepID=A0ABS5AER2_9PSEU|nr:hypothetical protein [Crossiella equi]MBP2474737.1 hypothetical protein [Crossiella equi]